MNTIEPQTAVNSEPQNMSNANCFNGDLSEIFAKPTLKEASSDNLTFDSVSTRDDEDSSSRSLVCFNSNHFEKNRKKKHHEPFSNITTLKEIVSKRKYTKRKQALTQQEQIESQEPTLQKKVKKEPQQPLQEKTQDSIKLDEANARIKLEDSQPKIVLHNGKAILKVPEPSSDQKTLLTVQKSSKLTTSQSFKKLNHTEKWAECETRKFYRALEIFGTDFSMIATLFPKRTRMQIKNKFVKEEKTNSERINGIFSKQKKGRSLKLLRRMSFLKANLPKNKDGNDEGEVNIGPRRRTDSINSLLSSDSLDRQIIQEMSDLLAGSRSYQA